PSVPLNSTSLDALDLLPSLSLRRCRRKTLRVPSGRMRGTAKHVTPSSVWASTRNRSHIGALQNHLWPVMRHQSPSGSAWVVLARTSEPPCFSVIAIPHLAEALPARSSPS